MKFLSTVLVCALFSYNVTIVTTLGAHNTHNTHNNTGNNPDDEKLLDIQKKVTELTELFQLLEKLKNNNDDKGDKDTTEESKIVKKIDEILTNNPEIAFNVKQTLAQQALAQQNPLWKQAAQHYTAIAAPHVISLTIGALIAALTTSITNLLHRKTLQERQNVPLESAPRFSAIRSESNFFQALYKYPYTFLQYFVTYARTQITNKDHALATTQEVLTDLGEQTVRSQLYSTIARGLAHTSLPHNNYSMMIGGMYMSEYMRSSRQSAPNVTSSCISALLTLLSTRSGQALEIATNFSRLLWNISYYTQPKPKDSSPLDAQSSPRTELLRSPSEPNLDQLGSPCSVNSDNLGNSDNSGNRSFVLTPVITSADLPICTKNKSQVQVGLNFI